jgi:hypothetical protein
MLTMTMLSDRDRANIHAGGARVPAGAPWRLMTVPLLGLLALAAIVILAGG